MIRITWNNLMPPRYKPLDIVNNLIKPSIFENANLRKDVRESAFYRKKNGTNLLTSLSSNTSGTDRSRLFSPPPILTVNVNATESSPSASRELAARMMELLLYNTVSAENIPYDYSSFPIKRAFKTQWMKIFGKVTPAVSESNLIVLSDEEQKKYKDYIEKCFFRDCVSAEDLEKCCKELARNARIKVNLTPVTIMIKGESLSSLLQSIQVCEQLLSTSEKDALFFERMAVLSIIASAWYIWEEAGKEEKSKVEEKSKNGSEEKNEHKIIGIEAVEKNTVQTWEENKHETKGGNQDPKCICVEQVLRLRNMLFPISRPSSLSSEVVVQCSDTLGASQRDKDNKLATDKLIEVRGLIDDEKYREAGILCEEIFSTYKNADDTILAKALVYLYSCCSKSSLKPLYFSSTKDILKEAHLYDGSYIPQQKSEILAACQKAKSIDSGICILNEKNAASEWVERTIPLNWTILVSEHPEKEESKSKKRRYILLSDDYSKNISDALKILDAIHRDLDLRYSPILDWKDTELYIRCHEEEVTPLLDTALSFFVANSEIEIDGLFQIFLIDEEKRSADYLFARYPLFYPLTFNQQRVKKLASGTAGKVNKETPPQTMHLVILSDNDNSRYVEWAIREAFWMLPRYDNNIHTKITILSPYATNICWSVNASCPGFTSFSTLDGQEYEHPYCISIDDITFPQINYCSTSFTNRALQYELEQLCTNDENLYFIVDSKSDLEGIRLGVKIREAIIRNTVFCNQIHHYSKYNFVIALRLSNADYAELAENLIVPKENEQDNRWFNSYNFISFGTLQSLYSWDELSGGILEKISQNIHLQYCNSQKDKKSCQKNLISYFRRLYNHDSSFAAAVSFPYRLFEAGVTPEAWYIQNVNAFWGKENRRELAVQFQGKLNREPDLVEKLAKYEHMRWCCYELSRGWLPATGDQTVQYMKAGVRRHVLQIAKLHPCICAWKKLENLQNLLNSEREHQHKQFDQYEAAVKNPIYDYFQRIDLKNIKETPSILQLQWRIHEHDKEVER